MPRSKNWKTYPDAYHELYAKAAVEVVRIPCESEKDAMSFRGQLYGFNAALEKEVQKKDGDETARKLRHISTKIQILIDGSALIIRPHDMDPRVQQVRRALNDTIIQEGNQDLLPLTPPQFIQDLAKKEGTSKG